MITSTHHQTDRTGGYLWLRKVRDQYQITIENKRTNFYELLINTPTEQSAQHIFNAVFEAIADPEFKNIY